MGFRTVVMLSNDYAHEWGHDPKLGEKIAHAMNYANDAANNKACVGSYGRVVECVHADTQTIAVLDGYSRFDAIAHKGWSRGESAEDVALRLLKEAADKLGYRLTRKATAKRAA